MQENTWQGDDGFTEEYRFATKEEVEAAITKAESNWNEEEELSWPGAEPRRCTFDEGGTITDMDVGPTWIGMSEDGEYMITRYGKLVCVI